VLAQSLQRVTSFVENTAKLFADWAQSYLPIAISCRQPIRPTASPWAVIPIFSTTTWELSGGPGPCHSYRQGAGMSFWNLQINNYWLESLDYRYHQICINKHQAQYDENGGVTLVLSEKTPALPTG
jgi:hypothetical protein